MLDQVALFEELYNYENILIAGAGGGYDVFSGLPLYLRLLEREHQVYLANYSFTQLYSEGEVPLIEVSSDSVGPDYFPEKYLCEWLDSSVDHCSTIYTFPKTGVKPLLRAYQEIVAENQIEAVVLVDGGTDSLMRGDEPSLATPVEDATSIAAVSQLDVPCKLLTCVGFGVDTYHGICHHYFLEAVAELTKQGHYLGTFSLLPGSEEQIALEEAARFVFEAMPQHPSIVLSSILSASQGEFGDFHATNRTEGSELYINPLMSIYWTFQLEGVVERSLYLEQILESQSEKEVLLAIQDFRKRVKKRPVLSMPV